MRHLIWANTPSWSWDTQKDVTSIMRGLEKWFPHLNREKIKFTVLGYGKGEKLIPRKIKSKASASCCTKVRMYTSVMVWELSRLEIYIKISPGTVISLEYLEEVNKKISMEWHFYSLGHRGFLEEGFYWRWVYSSRYRYKNMISTQKPTIIKYYLKKMRS